MIIVSVQLLSAVDGRHDELARMEICNMGTGTATTGNYSAETLRGRSTKDFARRTRQRIAYVNGHARQREHIWNLVAKALRNLCYGDWNEAELIEVTGSANIQIVQAAGLAQNEAVPADVVSLVCAARQIIERGYVSTAIDDERPDAEALSKALEAFAARVCYDDEGGSIDEAHADPCTCGLDRQ